MPHSRDFQRKAAPPPLLLPPSFNFGATREAEGRPEVRAFICVISRLGLANRLLQVGLLPSIASRPLSPATSVFAVSIRFCAFIYDDSSFVNFCGITAIFRQCLKPVAGVGRESATSSHRSSNRSAWLPASKSRRTKYASHDAPVSSKDDGFECLYS